MFGLAHLSEMDIRIQLILFNLQKLLPKKAWKRWYAMYVGGGGGGDKQSRYNSHDITLTPPHRHQQEVLLDAVMFGKVIRLSTQQIVPRKYVHWWHCIPNSILQHTSYFSISSDAKKILQCNYFSGLWTKWDASLICISDLKKLIKTIKPLGNHFWGTGAELEIHLCT